MAMIMRSTNAAETTIETTLVVSSGSAVVLAADVSSSSPNTKL